MGTLSITLIGLLLTVKLYCFESCMQLTNLCPSTKELWEERTGEFPCRTRDTSYACLLNAENQLVETCIYEVEVEKGVVGCPYVTLCLNGFPQVGTENKYTDCPKNIPGCPDKDHETYTLHELYKYPACFSANKSELLYTTGTTPPNTTSRIFGNEHKTTKENSFALPSIIFGIIVVIAIATYILFNCERKHSQKHMPLDNALEKKLLLSEPAIPSTIHMEISDDRLVKTTRQYLSDDSEIGSDNVFREREDMNEREKQCEIEMTKIKVLTDDVPEWEGHHNGVSAKCSQMTGSITWTERPVSGEILKGARVTLTSVRVKFVEDGKLEIISEVLSGVTDIDYYFILRKKVNRNEWELLDKSSSTRTFIFTNDSPKWENYFYGIAARRSGRKESVTWTTLPVSESTLKRKALIMGSLYTNNMPKGGNKKNALLGRKRLTTSSISIKARLQEISEKQPQGPGQLYWTMPTPKASEALW